MKKVLLLSIVASAFAFAGGDIAPTSALVPDVSSQIKFYIGGGYSRINADAKGPGGGINWVGVGPDVSLDANNYLLLAGVQFNQYIAIEGRYSNSFNNLRFKDNTIGFKATLPNSEIESYSIYAKPMYPITDKVNIYGLLGYANVRISDIGGKFMDDGDFSYGVGVSYKTTDRLAVFADFTRLYDNNYNNLGFLSDYKVKADSINAGFTYTF